MVLQRLLPTVDALGDIRPAALGRLGFGYEDRQSSIRTVYAAATGFGQKRPWRNVRL